MRRNYKDKKRWSRTVKFIISAAVTVSVLTFALIELDININKINIGSIIDISFFKREEITIRPAGEPEQKIEIVTVKHDDDNESDSPVQENKSAELITDVEEEKEDTENFEPIPPDISTIKINQVYSDSLIKREDTNTHKFTLDSECGINITFKITNIGEASYKLAVKDSFGRTLAGEFIDGEKLITRTAALYLRKGTYTLEIKRGNSWNGEIYKFSVNTLNDLKYFESEYNDSESRANRVPVNHDIHASTGTADDVDYFIFTLNNLSSVCPEFKFTPIDSRLDDSKLKLYTLTIAGLNSGETRNFTFRGDSVPSRPVKPFTLRAGSYIVSVSREKRKGLDLNIHEYTLRINAQ